jgi:hypothetical protein
VLDQADALRLLVDVANHLAGMHANRLKLKSDAFRWASASGLYGVHSACQLRYAFYRALRDDNVMRIARQAIPEMLAELIDEFRTTK